MLSTPRFDRSVRPIFIIGAPRSGTSITTWAVGQLPNVQTMPETSWIAPMATAAHVSFGYGDSRGRHSHLSNVAYEQPYFMRRIGEAIDAIVNDCYVERCHRLYGDFEANGELRTTPEFQATPFQVRHSVDEPKRRWIDGTPYNTYFTWGLAQMFPEAVFIHNLRRPEDVATSLEGFDKFEGQDALALADGLHVWSTHTEHAWLTERALGKQRVFRLHFERLANDPEALFREVAAFLGEEYSERMLAPLGTRINSSEVDDKRAGNLARLSKVEAFRTCDRLYKDMLATPPGEPDADAMERLRASFVEHAAHHPLI